MSDLKNEKNTNTPNIERERHMNEMKRKEDLHKAEKAKEDMKKKLAEGERE